VRCVLVEKLVRRYVERLFRFRSKISATVNLVNVNYALEKSRIRNIQSL